MWMWHKFPINFGFDGCQPHSSGKLDYIYSYHPSFCYLHTQIMFYVCFYVILWIMENWNVDNIPIIIMGPCIDFPNICARLTILYLHISTSRIHILYMRYVYIILSSLCVKKMAFCVCLFCNEYNGLCLQMGNSTYNTGGDA